MLLLFGGPFVPPPVGDSCVPNLLDCCCLSPGLSASSTCAQVKVTAMMMACLHTMSCSNSRSSSSVITNSSQRRLQPLPAAALLVVVWQRLGAQQQQQQQHPV